MKRLHQGGDTIVEVLMAMAVIGMILGISYGAASRSLALGRGAQERTEAVKLLESQIERLQYLANSYAIGPVTSGNNIFDTVDKVWCIDNSNPPQRALNETGAGSPCVGLGLGGFTNITVTYQPDAPGPPVTLDSFLLQAEWVRPGGSNLKDNVTLIYKIQK